MQPLTLTILLALLVLLTSLTGCALGNGCAPMIGQGYAVTCFSTNPGYQYTGTGGRM
jgi:hypothetical protein